MELRKAAEWLRHASHTVVLTGAGMSVESGIPDFRSPAGWWRQIDPRTVATVEALEQNYELFHAFYTMRLVRLEDVRPHRGHALLAEWEQRGLVRHIATQNVDGLHRRAGSRDVSELHGDIRRIRCHACGGAADEADFVAGEPCAACGGRLRPGVVLFGETLPEAAWSAALAHIRRAELIIVIGTSLEVYPVSSLPAMNGTACKLYINLEHNGHVRGFDGFVQQKAGDALQAIDDLLRAAG